MLFIEDLSEGRSWVAPAPIGYVERGWAGIVDDLLDDIERVVRHHPEAVVDIVDVSERDGRLRFVCVVGGDGQPDPGVAASIEKAVAAAALRSSRACRRCGRASWEAAAARSGRQCSSARHLMDRPDGIGSSYGLRRPRRVEPRAARRTADSDRTLGGGPRPLGLPTPERRRYRRRDPVSGALGHGPSGLASPPSRVRLVRPSAPNQASTGWRDPSRVPPRRHGPARGEWRRRSEGSPEPRPDRPSMARTARHDAGRRRAGGAEPQGWGDDGAGTARDAPGRARPPAGHEVREDRRTSYANPLTGGCVGVCGIVPSVLPLEPRFRHPALRMEPVPARVRHPGTSCDPV